MANKKSKEKGQKPESKKLSVVEFEKAVLDVSNKGLTAEKIGEDLRNKGIHSKDYGKKLSSILKENGKYVSPDLTNIQKKLDRIIKHFEKNKQDKRAMREKDRVFSQLRRTKAYLKVQ